MKSHIQACYDKLLSILSSKENRLTLIIILSGLLLRLVLMPITLHHDLVSTLWRSTLLNYDIIERSYGSAELIISKYLLFLKPFLPNLPKDLAFGSYNSLTIGPDSMPFLQFLGGREMFRYIFLVKLPFLLVDFALLWVIIKYFSKNKWTVIFWAVNPFIIYSTFMWGRFEIFPVFFATLALAMTMKQRPVLAVIFLYIAIMLRMPFIIYLPVIIIANSKNWKQAIWLSLIGLVPYLLSSQFVPQLFQKTPVIMTPNNFTPYLFTAKIGDGFNAISLFFIAEALIVFFAIKEKIKNQLTFKKVVFYLSLTVFSFYTFSFFNPQYIGWITPIIFLLIYIEKRIFFLAIAAFLPLFLFYDLYFKCNATLCLLQPLSPTFFNSIFSISSQWPYTLPSDIYASFFRTIFVILLIYIVLIIRNKAYENNPE